MSELSGGHSDETVLYAEGDGIATITMNRPSKKNAFNAAQYDGVRKALDAADESSVRAVVIKGAGGAFSAGADITEWAEPPVFDDGEEHGFVPFALRLASFEKPLIASVDGVAVGIGVTMLFHCDFVLATPESRFRTPFVSLGVLPEAGSSLLGLRLLGRQDAMNLLVRGAWLSADEAGEAGLVWKVVERDRLDAEVEAIATDFAALPLRQLRMAKQLLMKSGADMLSAALEREMAAGASIAGSPENREAISAFLEKRKADFSQFD